MEWTLVCIQRWFMTETTCGLIHKIGLSVPGSTAAALFQGCDPGAPQNEHQVPPYTYCGFIGKFPENFLKFFFLLRKPDTDKSLFFLVSVPV